MNSEFADIVKGVAVVALTAYALRWLFNAKRPEAPRTDGDVRVYGIRWRIRAVGYAAAALFACIAYIGLSEDWHTLARWPLHLLFFALALLALYFATGAILVTSEGITKKSLWVSQSLRWKEISRVQVHKRDAGAIELQAGVRKLVVDSRFVCTDSLLKEVEERTRLQTVHD